MTFNDPKWLAQMQKTQEDALKLADEAVAKLGISALPQNEQQSIVILIVIEYLKENVKVDDVIAWFHKSGLEIPRA